MLWCVHGLRLLSARAAVEHSLVDGVSGRPGSTDIAESLLLSVQAKPLAAATLGTLAGLNLELFPSAGTDASWNWECLGPEALQTWGGAFLALPFTHRVPKHFPELFQAFSSSEKPRG